MFVIINTLEFHEMFPKNILKLGFTDLKSQAALNFI